MSEGIFEINEPDVVHEVIEGEAILINMTTGSYYSLDGVGGLVWELLQQGPTSASDVAAALRPAVTGDAVMLESEIAKFLQELHAEGLVRPAASSVALKPLQREPQPFKQPVFSKYTDLEALLLIDPIHDVTTQGWPNVKSPDDS